LEKLHSEIALKIKSLESEISAHSSNSKRELAALQGKSKNLNDAIVDVRSGSGTPKHDPCLLKIILEKALEFAKGKDEERESALQEMRFHAAAFEVRVIDSLKGILGGLVKGDSVSMKALGETLAGTLDSVDANEEAQLLTGSQENVVRNQTQLPSFDYGLDDPNARVVKSTGLMRQKAIIKSSFAQCHGLLVYL
jgi:hypothetical protein